MGLPGISDLKNTGKRETVKRLLKSEKGAAALSILVEAEQTLIASVLEQHETLGITEIDTSDLPSKDDRVSQLQAVALAKIEGRFPAHFVETYFDGRLDHASEAAQFADLDDDEWTAKKAEWAASLRDQGVDGGDEELARAHARTRYGIDLDEFEALVVNWPDGRETDELKGILASGVQLANEGINETTRILEEADVEIDVDDQPASDDGE